MFGFVKQGIDSLYDSTADIWTFEEDVKDNNSVFIEDKLKPSKTYTDKPCRVSQKNIGGSSDGAVKYETRLFISSELNIPAGSRVVVTDKHDNVTEYVRTGEPFKYSNHQEITLLRDDVS